MQSINDDLLFSLLNFVLRKRNQFRMANVFRNGLINFSSVNCILVRTIPVLNWAEYILKEKLLFHPSSFFCFHRDGFNRFPLFSAPKEKVEHYLSDFSNKGKRGITGNFTKAILPTRKLCALMLFSLCKISF